MSCCLQSWPIDNTAVLVMHWGSRCLEIWPGRVVAMVRQLSAPRPWMLLSGEQLTKQCKLCITPRMEEKSLLSCNKGLREIQTGGLFREEPEATRWMIDCELLFCWGKNTRY